MNNPLTYRELFVALPAQALDQPVRIFMKDQSTWIAMATAGTVADLDDQGDLNGEISDQAWILSSR